MPAALLRPPPIRPVGHPPTVKRAPMGLSKRVKACIEDMIYLGLARKDAARKHGLADNSLYIALRNPQVMTFYNDQLDVFRASLRPRAVARLGELIDAKSEKVSLDAAKYVDSGGKDGSGVTVNLGVNISPGYLIDVSGYDQGKLTQIEHQALIGRKPLK